MHGHALGSRGKEKEIRQKIEDKARAKERLKQITQKSSLLKRLGLKFRRSARMIFTMILH